MVQTRKRAARAPTSDDEAPEEVPRADSKRQAQATAEQEQEAAAAAAAAAASRRSRKSAVKQTDEAEAAPPATSPAKRQRRSTATAHKHTLEQQQEDQPATTPAADGPSSAGAPAAGDASEALDLLSEDVLATLAAHRSRATANQQASPAGRPQQQQQQQQQQHTQQRRVKQRVDTLAKGPVTVAVLGSKARSAPSASAAAFLQQRIKGSSIPRSATMLAPPRAYANRPAPGFVQQQQQVAAGSTR